MWLINLFKRKKTESLKALRTERPGIKLRLKTKKKQYRAVVALTYKGKPLRQFDVTENGYSRDAVAASIEEHMGFKLISVVQLKQKRK